MISPPLPPELDGDWHAVTITISKTAKLLLHIPTLHSSNGP